MPVKRGKVFPQTGKMLPGPGDYENSLTYARVVGAALRKDLYNRRGAAKTVMQWTGASERTVKTWFSGRCGPSGEHLMMLACHSDSVFLCVLRMSGRGASGSRAKFVALHGYMVVTLAALDDMIRGDN